MTASSLQDTVAGVEKLRRAYEPDSILDVIQEETIHTLLAGFALDLRCGAALLYAKRTQDGLTVQRDWRIDHTHAMELFNPLCWAYRNRHGIDQCLDCDRMVAESYVAGQQRDPTHYPCWLGLQDLAFPIRLGEQCYAVVFAGQVVPNEPSDREKLGHSVLKVAPELRGSLEEAILAQDKEASKLKPDEGYSVLEARVKKLKRFGVMLQAIVDQIWEARTNAATSAYSSYLADALSRGNLDESDSWWKQCADRAEEFKDFLGLSELRLYSRKRTYFRQEVPRGEQSETRIPVRDVVCSIAADQLVPAGSSQSGATLENVIGITPDGVTFHRSQTEAGPLHLSTLLALKGEIPPARRDVVAQFCRAIGLRSEIASLVFELKDVHKRYLGTVGETAHEFRTPLQAIILDLQALSRRKDSVPEDVRVRLEAAIERARQVLPLIDQLQRKATEKRENLDVGAEVQSAVTIFAPVAERHPCRLIFTRPPEGKFKVRSTKDALARIFRNLLGNAIKYSWHGDQYYVPITIDYGPEGHVSVTFVNYGIGIPSEMLGKVKEQGYRALVNDQRFVRQGTGFGFAIAFNAAKDLDGWIEIQSEPADSDPRPPGEEYHRYLTTVKAMLPTI